MSHCFFSISSCYIGHHLSYLFGGFGVPEKSVRNSTGSNNLCFSTVLHTAYPSIFIMFFFFIAGSIPTWGYSSRNNWTYLDILYNSIYRIISQLVGVGILLLYHVISICNSLNPTNIHDVMTNPQYSWFISTSIPYIYPQLFTRVDFKSHLYIYIYMYLYLYIYSHYILLSSIKSPIWGPIVG